MLAQDRNAMQSLTESFLQQRANNLSNDAKRCHLTEVEMANVEKDAVNFVYMDDERLLPFGEKVVQQSHSLPRI